MNSKFSSLREVVSTRGSYAPYAREALDAERENECARCEGMRAAVRMLDGWHLDHVVRVSAEGAAWRGEWQTVEIIDALKIQQAIDWVDAWERRTT